MSYQVLYRAHRPQEFSDVVGQKHIIGTIQNALTHESLSHAYLLCGPRGTGKTSIAKIIAKTVNCINYPTNEPCNECINCTTITNGSNSDVLEMDAASNNGVDEIREIRDKIEYAPTMGHYKVYIIDEVHMLSTGAFNALLKTLEEPPEHAIFILATTEPHKIPSTIISRCQRFDFKQISTKEIYEHLVEIIKQQDLAYEEEAIQLVSELAEGGMRDALSILDQAISYSEDQVELDDVLAVTGGVSQKVLTDIVKAMHEKDVEQALQLLDDLIQRGKDPGRFVYDLIYFMRDLLLFKSAPSLEGLLERARVDDNFLALSDSVSTSWIQDAIIQLNQCQQEIKWTNSPKVFIEIAVLTITNRYHAGEQATADVDSEAVTKLMSKMSQLEKELTNLKQQPAQHVQAPAASEKRRQPARGSKNSYKIPFERIRDVLGKAEKPALKQVQSQWANFLSKLKQVNAPAHATIQDSKPAAASADSLVVAFKYEIHCSLFLDNREAVESVLTSVMDKQLTIIPIPDNDWTQLRTEYISKQDKPKDEEQGDPLVDEARKLFGDELLEIHD